MKLVSLVWRKLPTALLMFGCLGIMITWILTSIQALTCILALDGNAATGDIMGNISYWVMVSTFPFLILFGMFTLPFIVVILLPVILRQLKE